MDELEMVMNTHVRNIQIWAERENIEGKTMEVSIAHYQELTAEIARLKDELAEANG